MGEFALIGITKGALQNENDLLVSPDHRLFVYQREDKLGAGRSEVLLKVRHLVNGSTVYQRDGGFVDYFQLLFDDHQIIYAEGIAAESLLIDPRTRTAVPDQVRTSGDSHGHRTIGITRCRKSCWLTPMPLICCARRRRPNRSERQSRCRPECSADHHDRPHRIPQP